MDLQTDIKFLPGVGPKRAEVLKQELQIFTAEDLLYHFPYKYTDRTKFYGINEINSRMPYIQIKGKITRFELLGKQHKQRLVGTFADDTGSIPLVWFKGLQWIKQNIQKGKEYVVFGKPSVFKGQINVVHPEMEEAGKQETKFSAALQPAYNTTEKMKKNFLTSKQIHKLLHTALSKVRGTIYETLPAYLIQKWRLMPLKDAIVIVHFPPDSEKLRQAQFRLKFEELFYIQLNLLLQMGQRKRRFKGYVFEKVGDYFNTFYHQHLPFELTGAQKRVLKEIRRDLGSGQHCNRLLQGDVGSGKTLVALMCMLIALDNGFQASLMAPTEILANQHFETVAEMLKDMPLNYRLLTGSTKTKQRRIIHDELQSGQLHILIGTHALIEDKVQFQNLGIVVVDEQHRFGVAQRAKMWGKNESPPHIVVMTATPIPRTLAMTVYGDLDVSVIDELPPGRQPVKTIHAYDSKRLRVFNFMRKQIAQGRQIYVVYPLIKESEKMDYKDLEDGYESITRAFPAPQYAVSIVHGQMKPEEKDKAMALFVKGQTQIMVATTVIEVGVNIPNATVMIIESAERFGLSQLHQLRGRVGRGAQQSYCVLMTSYKLSADARKRLQIMTETNDGFRIAEEDMKLRGPGDIEGTQQSGLPFSLKIANLTEDGPILQHARRVATEVLNADRLLEKDENQLLKKQLKKLTKGKLRWDLIS